MGNCGKEHPSEKLCAIYSSNHGPRSNGLQKIKAGLLPLSPGAYVQCLHTEQSRGLSEQKTEKEANADQENMYVCF